MSLLFLKKAHFGTLPNPWPIVVAELEPEEYVPVYVAILNPASSFTDTDEMIFPLGFDTAAPPAFQHHTTKLSPFSFTFPELPTVYPPSLKLVTLPDAVFSTVWRLDDKLFKVPLTVSFNSCGSLEVLDLIHKKSGLNSNPDIVWPEPLPV